MKMNMETNKRYILFSTLYVFLTGGVCVYVLKSSESIAIKIVIVVFSILIFLLNISLLFLLRRQILLFSSEFIGIMDDMINGKDNLIFDRNQEGLPDKISMKLKRLYEILRSAKEQSEQEKRCLEETITDISHQIKTPLSNLKMYNSTILTRKMPQEKMIEFCMLMGKQMDKLEFLTTQMIKVSRMEIGTIHLSVKNQQLYDTVAAALSGIVLPAELKSITVIPPVPTDVMVPHDSKWTAEALFNILDNAVKYTETGGTIRITIQQTELTTMIAITDTGKGIREENRYRIFNRFFREEDVHETAGIGIGLYLTREIIAKQKGYLRVTSELGKGTTIAVYFPNS